MRLLKKTTNSGASIPRIARMADHDLASWANLTIMDLGRAFDNYHYKDGPAQEVTTALNALNDIWAELEQRKS